MKHKYTSSKTYSHDIGISAAFRQWRATSHCRFLHGYALSFKFVFSAYELDNNGWVVDFGALKELKALLIKYFDHKLLIASDDPQLPLFITMRDAGVCDLVILPEGTGCESFAKLCYELCQQWMNDNGHYPRCSLDSVEVKEHGANGATYGI
jgi:6-pyruvoyltetrahydropterin/6-carboxytetrahydropterin synthase